MQSSTFLSGWFGVRQELSKERRTFIGWASFLLPILIWCAVSYVPFIWHPAVLVENIGDVDYFQEGMRIDKAIFQEEFDNMQRGRQSCAARRACQPHLFTCAA